MKRLLLSLGVVVAITFATGVRAQVPPDVPPGHWAYDAIEELVRDGILKGYPDGTFKGRAPLTRYEFAVAIRDALAALREQMDELQRRIPTDTVRPPTPEPPRPPADVLTPEEKAKLGRIPADTAERLQRLEEGAAQVRRLATEFQDELASLGVDVEAVKRDLSSLRKRIDAMEAELARFRLSGTVDFIVVGSNSIDNLTAIDLNAQPTAPGGLLGNINVLHELGLNISSKLSETATADATLIVGNWLPYLGSASQFGAAGAGNTDIVLWKAAVNAPISILGTEVGLTIGRFENRINPLTLWRPDVDVYTSIDRYDNGYYSMDGAKASVGFGSVQVGLFAARNNTVNTNNGGNFMAVHGGAGNAQRPSLAAGHPATATVAGIGAFDSSAGATVDVNLGERLSLSAEVVTMKRATSNVAPFGNVNRLNVYGGHLKASVIDRLTITADYAQTDLLLQESNRNNKDNWALLVGLGYTFGENLSLSAGYREVRPYFAAPGYWGRIGYWHNPVDIKGADVALAWKLGSLAIDAKGGLYKGSDRPASLVGKNDEITHIAAGVAWTASEAVNLKISYEGVLWNLKTSSAGRKPQENYVTLGVDYKIGDNALLKLLYQVVDYDPKAAPGWGTKGRAGVAVAQFGVKF